MIFIALLLIIAIPILVFRANPERAKAHLADVFGIEGFGLRAALLIAAPAASIAWVVTSMWFGRLSGGAVTYIPIAVAAFPFALPILAYLTGNGDKFKASFALRTFYGLCVLSLILVLTGTYKLVLGGHGKTGLLTAQTAGFWMVVIGAIGATMGSKIAKIVKSRSSRMRYIPEGPLPPYRDLPMIDLTKKNSLLEKKAAVTTPQDNFTEAGPLPKFRLEPGELKVPKFE